jgi:hypothetical protein
LVTFFDKNRTEPKMITPSAWASSRIWVYCKMIF